ncbi:type II toxin-antitoxin system VapC family toxin [Paracoccus aestuarii]|uniref:Type II toxin-antitoxin system VapC family toxin n=1 Tax=Paracoccus aestuarii TaxID=453842 RepID=A0A418ZR95_9RHOB|nr:type II toxin-antitoxin system VapC family toxin [Paracoccus aestuarii]RJK98906.1 type II toxin-antitoxin system VapC family toxin [Paracoccus aestuarii]WCR01226.1 type II toxin-antitoxin system VapC family toxin [Paracoccus aestuarii]
MNYLIDTHLLLWAAFGADRLPDRARAIMAEPRHRLWFSAASIWEVSIKRALDRPDFRVDPGVLRAGLLSNDYHELPVEGRHCLALTALPALHSDPFDRMLLAQAITEGLILLTADRAIGRYGGPVEMV